MPHDVKTSATRRVLRIRAELLESEPFWGFLAMRLKVKEDASCVATWSDGVTLGVNPGYLATLMDLELKGLLAANVAHLAAGHQWRRGERDYYLWNEACAYAAHELVLEAGYRLPADALCGSKYRGKSAEHIYAALLKETPPEPPPEPEPEASESDGDDESPDEEKDDAASDASDGDDADDSDGAGDPDDFELTPSSAPALLSEVRDPEVESEGEKENLECAWNMALESAAGMQGDLPEGLRRTVDRQMEGASDWRSLLASFIQSSYSQEDYTYAKPNLRYMASGFIMPSMQGNTMPPLILVKDTSNSIFDIYRALWSAELTGLIEQMKPEAIWVLDIDDRVRRVQTALRNEEEDLVHDTVGNGGTKFWPAIKWVSDECIEPCCMVYLTDLYGEFPKEEPPYPVLWMVPDADICIPEAPFGEVVRITLDRHA